MHVVRACGSAMRPLLHPIDSISPCPRNRMRESSRAQTMQRVPELPASSPAAICTLELTVPLYGCDPVVQPQIEGCRIRYFSVNIRVVLHEILQPRRKVAISQH